MDSGPDFLGSGGVALDFGKLSTSDANVDVDFTLFDDAAMLDVDQMLLFEPSAEADDDTTATSSAPRAYHAKRPHKKSRAGCTNCKRRKVKCSETRPACQACILRKDNCVYPKAASQGQSSTPTNTNNSGTPLAAPSRTSSSPVTPQDKALTLSPAHGSHRGGRSPSVVSIDPADTIIIKEPLFRPPEMADMTDMKLLWFYTTETFSSFSVETRRSRLIDDALRVKVVEHAFQSPFLMQCLLGLSALQLRSLGQPMTAKKAAEYSSKAFEGYRGAIQNAEPGDYPALLAASLLMCALSTEMFREHNKKRLCVIDWMTVWRGIGLIVDLITPKSIHESGLAVLFYRPPIDLEKTFRFIPNNLLFMVSSIPPEDADYPHQQTYYDALKYLGSLYMELQHGFSPILDLRVITFFTFIPRLFLPLAREERPRALIILAHYLTFTKLNTSVWWMQGLADREIGEICSMLGEPWADLTIVPQNVRLAKDRVQIARTIIENHNWHPTEQGYLDRVQRDPRSATLALVNDEGLPVRIVNNQWVFDTTDLSAKHEALKSSPDKVKPFYPSSELASKGGPPVTERPGSPMVLRQAATAAFVNHQSLLESTAETSSLIGTTAPLDANTPGDLSCDSSVSQAEQAAFERMAMKNTNCHSSGSSETQEDAPFTIPTASYNSAYGPSPAASDSPGSSTYSPAVSYPTPHLSHTTSEGSDDKGTAEEKWALMGKLEGRRRQLDEFTRIPNSDDELLSRQLNL